MSVIAGIVHFNQEPIEYENGLALMQALQNYPANATDYLQKPNVFLGCRALWITPESINERLPVYDHDLKLAITADAILDNRNELLDLLQLPHDIRHRITDSRIIMLAYRKWGQDAPKYFVGEFAFMIWDENKRRLFGARDLQGGRTLYYHYDHHRFVFCSTIMPLFSQPHIEKQLNESWLAEFLAIPIMVASSDVSSTVYQDIKQIPPGHSVSITDGSIMLSKFGSILPEETIKYSSDQDYVDAFRDIYQEAITSKMRTYRKVGATLSGGLDSSSVVTFAAKALRQEGKTLLTYSSVPVRDFEDWTTGSDLADESPYIRATVDFVGNIQPYYLDLPDKSPYSEIDDWLDLMESPYKNVENSHWIKGIYEFASQQDVGILLTGAKGNYTVSWGSAVDYYSLLLKRLRWLSFYRELTQFGRNTGVRRSRILKVIGKVAFPQVFDRNGYSSQDDTPSLIHPSFADKMDIWEKLVDQGLGLGRSDNNVWQERQNFFNNLSVQNHQGTIASKLSARYGLWERDPTSDLRVVRYCLAIPFDQYMKNGIGRSLVRRATAEDLPDQVRLNDRKRGYQGADWVHRMAPSWKALVQEVHALCEDSLLSDYINIKQVQSSLSKLGNTPRPEYAAHPDAKVLMRSLILYRFFKSWNSSKGGDTYAKASMGST